MSEETDVSVAELMARDPLSLTKDNIEAIVTQLRKQRAKYVQGNVQAGKPQAKKSKAQLDREAALKIAGGDQLDLGDLGL